MYDGVYNQQRHIVNTSRKTFTCCAFSACGKYVATGEVGVQFWASDDIAFQSGHEPMVRVWDVGTRQQVQECKAHTFAVACVVSAAAE